MITTVEIEWDAPVDELWLCPDNIKLALEACCANTKFKVKRVEVISMLTRFSSVDELLNELASCKFPMVGIPYAWKFGGLVRVDKDRPDVLLIKDKEFSIVTSIVNDSMIFIIVPGA